MDAAPNWAPFRIATATERTQAPRAVTTLEGVCDRLRAAAFAERQAEAAFEWAADRWQSDHPALAASWRELAAQERKHLGWLLGRLKALGGSVAERRVSEQLWHSLISCQDARTFALYMAQAEDRGRRAGERFAEQLSKQDPESGRIFGQIALEERSHIELIARFFPEDWESQRFFLPLKPATGPSSQTPWSPAR